MVKVSITCTYMVNNVNIESFSMLVFVYFFKLSQSMVNYMYEHVISFIYLDNTNFILCIQKINLSLGVLSDIVMWCN